MAKFNVTPQSVASNVLSASQLLTSSLSVDVVSILNQETMEQIFVNARPMKARVRETARVMNYPVETGAIYSDHRITDPVEIEQPLLINANYYSSTYQEIRNAFVNATSLVVQTRTGSYRNMIVAQMPHDEDPEIFNAIVLFVKFQEVIVAAPASIAQPSGLSNYSPRRPQDSLNINRGLVSGIAAASGILSYFRARSVWGK